MGQVTLAGVAVLVDQLEVGRSRESHVREIIPVLFHPVEG